MLTAPGPGRDISVVSNLPVYYHDTGIGRQGSKMENLQGCTYKDVPTGTICV